MYFKFGCEKCGKNLKARGEDTGRKCRCPYCHHTMAVPSAPATDDFAEALRNFDPDSIPKATESGAKQVGRPDRTVATPSKPESPRSAFADGTNVSMLRSGLIGLGAAFAFLVLMWPFKSFYLGELFLDRGWVPFVLTFLMAWSAATLFLKSRKLARQKESMLFDVLPNELSDEISVSTLDKFTGHIRSLPVDPRESFLINRVLRGLEHFRVRKSNPEVAGMLASQSEIDANAVESSYTLLKVFIWAIPILGFVGTVIGISAAVGGFSGSLDAAQDISVLKESLNSVTGGLATAFDTTLVALVMSMLVMFPTSSMQKAEEDLLNWVDEYCNENLLKRLNDADGMPPQSGNYKDDLQKAVDAAIAGKQGAMLQQIQQVQEKVTQLQHEQVDKLEQAMNGLTERTAAVQNEVSGSMRSAARSLENYFSSMERGLSALNGVLESLGEKQVVVQAPPKRRWGLFGRRDGR